MADPTTTTCASSGLLVAVILIVVVMGDRRRELFGRDGRKADIDWSSKVKLVKQKTEKTFMEPRFTIKLESIFRKL